jgi:PucR-like helix-turn-helix protein/diguanylate cyclase with GGDEF domain
MSDRRPWHDLPPAVAATLRPELPAVAQEIIDALREGVPDYARPLEGAFGRGIRVGVEAALEHFMAEVEASDRVPRAHVYVDLGRGEHRAGRSLEALLSAYRLGARVAWRHFAAAGRRARLDPDTLYGLAESIFAYIDELSAESAEGYALEQSAAAGAAQLRRRRLVRLLVRDPPAEPDAVEAAALEAGWPLPRVVAVLVVAGDTREEVGGRLGPDVAADVLEDEVVALIPDPDGPGRRRALRRAIDAAGATAALGPSVAWPDCPMSLARARAALALARAGAVPGHSLVVAADHGAALLLSSDPRLVADLVRDRLAPLDALAAGSQDRMAETLEAWLAAQGRLQPAAERLGVHPQTVRYRLRRLREAFGSSLDDPDRRFELDLALRTRAFLAAQREDGR